MPLKDTMSALEAEDEVSQPKVTPHYFNYLEMPEHERPGAAGGPPWSKAALEHRRKVEDGEYKRNRTGRYSPSSITKCERRVMFGYQGAPEAPRLDLALENMAGFGNMRHLYWQMVGITMGFLDAGEVWTHHDTFSMGGSMDGTGPECDVFELKSVASTKYSRIVSVDRAPLYEHRMQLAAYFLASGREWASLVYEDRNYGGVYEFRVQRNDNDEDEIIRLMRRMKGHIDLNTLPEMLEDCERQVGQLYRDCQYSEHCHAVARR